MTHVHRPLIAALVLFTGAIVLDRIGLGSGHDVISTGAYLVAFAAVALPLLVSNLHRPAATTHVIAALAIALTVAALAGTSPASAIHLRATELGFVGLAAWLGHRLATSTGAIAEMVAVAASGRSPALDLEGPVAANEIQTELARSRRHDRPVSVTVIGPTEGGLETALEHASLELDRAVRTRFLYGSLARAVAKRLRRSDLLFEHRPTGRLVVLSPETDADGTALLVRKLTDAAAGSGIEVNTGSATFPDDGIGFEALVDHAEADLARSATPQLQAIEEGVA